MFGVKINIILVTTCSTINTNGAITSFTTTAAGIHNDTSKR